MRIFLAGCVYALCLPSIALAQDFAFPRGSVSLTRTHAEADFTWRASGLAPCTSYEHEIKVRPKGFAQPLTDEWGNDSQLIPEYDTDMDCKYVDRVNYATDPFSPWHVFINDYGNFAVGTTCAENLELNRTYFITYELSAARAEVSAAHFQVRGEFGTIKGPRLRDYLEAVKLGVALRDTLDRAPAICPSISHRRLFGDRIPGDTNRLLSDGWTSDPESTIPFDPTASILGIQVPYSFVTIGTGMPSKVLADNLCAPTIVFISVPPKGPWSDFPPEMPPVENCRKEDAVSCDANLLCFDVDGDGWMDNAPRVSPDLGLITAYGENVADCNDLRADINPQSLTEACDCDDVGDCIAESCGDACTSICPYGDGLYCGVSDGQVVNSLYRCTAGVFALVEVCSAGCEDRGPGVNDACRTTSCTNDCNATTCVGETEFRTCGSFDDDSCLDHGVRQQCPVGQVCRGQGQCVSCGGIGDPCCPRSVCGGASQCSEGTCVDLCGGLNCDDRNPCTTDSCSAGQCRHTSRSNGTACTDDLNPCTTDECVNGMCSHSDVTCPAGTTCNSAGQCEPATCPPCFEKIGAQCLPKANGTSCGGTHCWDFSPCQNGFTHVCDETGTRVRPCWDLVCQDGTCVEDARDEVEACTRNVNYTLCADDNNACTEDVCIDGGCVHNPVVCQSDQTCVNGRCEIISCPPCQTKVNGTCVPMGDGTSCGVTTCDGYAGCTDYSNTCDESGTQYRACYDAKCSGGSCSSFGRTESRSCERDTDGAFCSSDSNSCTNDVCANGSCTHPSINDCGSRVCGPGANNCVASCGTCQSGQSCVSGACQVTCGNGTCTGSETPASCPTDCSPSSGGIEYGGRMGATGCTSTAAGWHCNNGMCWTFGTSCALAPANNPTSYSFEWARKAFTVRRAGRYNVTVRIPTRAEACSFTDTRITTSATYRFVAPNGAVTERPSINQRTSLGQTLTLVSNTTLSAGTATVYLYDKVGDLTNCCDTCGQSIRVFVDNNISLEWLGE